MIPRPRLRLPLWVPFVVVAIAYAVRSAMRGFDFRPDGASDGFVLVLLLVIVGAVAWMRADIARQDAEIDPTHAEEETGPES